VPAGVAAICTSRGIYVEGDGGQQQQRRKFEVAPGGGVGCCMTAICAELGDDVSVGQRCMAVLRSWGANRGENAPGVDRKGCGHEEMRGNNFTSRQQMLAGRLGLGKKPKTPVAGTFAVGFFFFFCF